MLLKMVLTKSTYTRKCLQIFCRPAHIGNTKWIGKNKDEGEFRVLDLRFGKRKSMEKVEKYEKPRPIPPREHKMPTDQDWSNVWPGPRTFHPASVPLPLRQGFDKKLIPPDKYANAELMKLPNFLHLTPPAIKKHCDAIKRFCTPWPEALKTEEDCWKHFPLEVTTTDYCHSSPKIRDPKARIVVFKFFLSSFALDKHAEDKIKRLLGERYDDKTGLVTFVTDRCPLRKQNYDYNTYLILATFYEAWKVDEWEAEKCEDDMEYYDWERNPSKYWYLIYKHWPESLGDIDVRAVSLDDDETAKQYKEAVTQYLNTVEDENTICKYKEGVKKVVLQT